nr:myosin-11-like isoform X2 [Tanacetum cinerariifolium]
MYWDNKYGTYSVSTYVLSSMTTAMTEENYLVRNSCMLNDYSSVEPTEIDLTHLSMMGQFGLSLISKKAALFKRREKIAITFPSLQSLVPGVPCSWNELSYFELLVKQYQH